MYRQKLSHLYGNFRGKATHVQIKYMNFHLFSFSDFVKMKPDEAFIKRINYYLKHEQHREIHQFNQLYCLK